MKNIFKIPILLIFFILLLSCDKETIKFTALGINQAYLVIMQETGLNKTEYFYYNGIKQIAKLLNMKKSGAANSKKLDKQKFQDNRYFLRINYLGVFYTIRFDNVSDFTMIIKGKKKNFYIPDFLKALIQMDRHPSFDIINVDEVRLFDRKFRGDAKIEITKAAALLDAISNTRDKFVTKEKFKLNPDLIIRIEKKRSAFQLFCKNDTIWITEKSGYYVYKSDKIKKAIQEITK